MYFKRKIKYFKKPLKKIAHSIHSRLLVSEFEYRINHIYVVLFICILKCSPTILFITNPVLQHLFSGSLCLRIAQGSASHLRDIQGLSLLISPSGLIACFATMISHQHLDDLHNSVNQYFPNYQCMVFKIKHE